MRNLRIWLARLFLPEGLDIVVKDDITAARTAIGEARDYIKRSGHFNNTDHATTRRARRRLQAYLRTTAAWLAVAFEIKERR